MKIKLQEIADLQSGVYLKSMEDPSAKKAYMVSLKDFDEELNFQHTAVEVEFNKVKEKYFVRSNHILFSSRLKFNAFRLPKDSSVNYVASSSFVIIKPDTKRVVPSYLEWCLNHPNLQQKLKFLSQATGRVAYISVAELEGLEIDLPKLSVQKEIVKLNELHKRENKLTQQLLHKKEQYLQTILLKTSKQ